MSSVLWVCNNSCYVATESGIIAYPLFNFKSIKTANICFPHKWEKYVNVKYAAVNEMLKCVFLTANQCNSENQ